MSLFRAGLCLRGLASTPAAAASWPTGSATVRYRCDFVHAAVSNRRDPLGSLWAYSHQQAYYQQGSCTDCVVPHLGSASANVYIRQPYHPPLFFRYIPSVHHFRLSRSVRSRFVVLPRSDVSRSLWLQSTSLNTSWAAVPRQG